MSLRIAGLICCLMTTSCFAQGYSGTFKVPDNNRIYYFTLLDGKLRNPVYTIVEGTESIYSMYLSDSIVLSGIDSVMTIQKKDSLLKQFLGNFSGTYAEYNKKGKPIAASYYPQSTDLDNVSHGSTEDQRMNFYPNGQPYAQFYQKNGHPSRSIVYFTRDGEVEQITDLSQYTPGEQVVIQNPYDFRLRRKKLTIVIE